MGPRHQPLHYALKESLAADRPTTMGPFRYRRLREEQLRSSRREPVVREHVEGKTWRGSDGDDLSKINQLDTHDELTILYGKVFYGINLSCNHATTAALTSRK
jgi:hypothetical protein